MMCRTFTHHVDGKIRVECVAHPRWHVDAEKTGEHSARAVAAAEQAAHEAEQECSCGAAHPHDLSTSGPGGVRP